MREASWRRYARFFRADVAADVDEELEFHIQTLTDKYVRAGHSPTQARAMALDEFGNGARAREACVDIDTRHARAEGRGNHWANLRQDLRHAARRLRKAGVFTSVTVLTLALGIGPNIAIFSIINSVLLRPLPFKNPDQIIRIYETFPVPGGTSGPGSVSLDNFLDWRAQSTVFSGMSLADYPFSANLQEPGKPQRLLVTNIGVDAFPLLGVRPVLGRQFLPTEATPNGSAVVLISESLWRRQYAADPNIVGRKITLDGVPRTVVGVIPAAIVFPNRATPMDAWLPLQAQPAPGSRDGHRYTVFGRLRPGATLAQATADMTTIAARIATEYPIGQTGRSVKLVTWRETVVGQLRPQLLVLLGAACMVLLIACANAASLLLARAAGRRREVAVLAALGASRWRLAQQFLCESLLLAMAGTVVAFGLAVAAVRAIVAAAGTNLPYDTRIRFDARVIVFIGGTVVLTALVFGMLPAIHAARGKLQSDLRDGDRSGTSRGGLRHLLVIGQFALSLVLLAGAGLMLRTFESLVDTETGMRVDNVLTMHVPVAIGAPPYTTAQEALDRFARPMLAQVRALPGVQAAGMISLLPLQDYGNNGNFGIAGQSYASDAEQPFAEFRVVTPGYFGTLGIPIERGRDVTEADDGQKQPVVLINDVLASHYFKGQDPVGKALQFGPPSPTNPPATIVGVVGSVHQTTLDAKPKAELYFALAEAQRRLSDMSLVVRTTSDPAAATHDITRVIRKIDPNQPIYRVEPMRDVVTESVSDRKLYLDLLAGFAGLALALAIAGIYGVMSYSVTQRTREFGIRLALGADSGRVQRLVVKQGALLAGAGLLLGVPIGLLLTRSLAAVLYGVKPGDPLTFTTVALLLALVALLASYLPARRVLRVDPSIAMRVD